MKQNNKTEKKQIAKNMIAEVFDLQKISNAVTQQEIDQAVENTTALFQNYFNTNHISTFKKVTSDFLKNPRDQEIKDKFYEELQNVVKRQGVKNGQMLKTTVHNFDEMYVEEARKSLVNEYKIATLSELMIVDLAINAYFRALRSASVYSILIQNKEGVINYGDQQKINMIKEVGKQTDLANHQFFTAITFLKELRLPPVRVKIQTNEAYIAQNQQINKPKQSTNP
ncbi:hypothetical protein A3C23_04660 [Candidatus Roizmanbacteria bacterium RIFCSPHIGHO2_02_FULL_37_13b]|uniref:Uncharacterized protein n=1 Tax=Candidatus Roizmanbacteria bacterium RIFCSPLOWO2_02_FULL_36_11 TaxID=1802071 RepID=A0A1F7JHC0_9BACT|nr:MAG: hypothetical protein A3C23_04660 [Candidatus Roizmanbacteria bacterium RIFCSPHIGHO2_02_FULL_37_13b]OGK54999.1 MAG: hypothetical protein A3H78_00805 [Candidatus Roizmanbacteria bacterium RIFCSPLOWO2_02_FULL_36_11]